MDRLHDVLRSIQPETKAGKDHLTVFREFLAHLDQLQRQAPNRNPSLRRKVTRRAK